MPISIKTKQFKKINTIIKQLENYLVEKIDCSHDSVSAEILFWESSDFFVQVFHTQCFCDISPLSPKNKDIRHFASYSENQKKYEYKKVYLHDLAKNSFCYPCFTKKLKLIKGILHEQKN